MAAILSSVTGNSGQIAGLEHSPYNADEAKNEVAVEKKNQEFQPKSDQSKAKAKKQSLHCSLLG